jgi:hypothetical protein
MGPAVDGMKSGSDNRSTADYNRADHRIRGYGAGAFFRQLERLIEDVSMGKLNHICLPEWGGREVCRHKKTELSLGHYAGRYSQDTIKPAKYRDDHAGVSKSPFAQSE